MRSAPPRRKKCRTKKARPSGLIHVEVLIGCTPSLERRLCEGLLEFGRTRPHWRFTMREAGFRHTGAWLREQRISGVLVLIDAGRSARVFDEAEIPWVHLLPGRPVAHPAVYADDLSIGRTGAEFFLRKGCLRSAFCGVGTEWSAVRAGGFRERIERAGGTCLLADIPFESGGHWGLGSAAERRLLQWMRGLSCGIAVMAAHDVLANRMVDLARQLGRRVPQDLSILGVGNHDLHCKLSPVPLSSIDANLPGIAIAGATMLEGMISGKKPPAHVTVPPRGVVERASTDFLFYGDELMAKIVAHIREHAGTGLAAQDLPTRFPITYRTLCRRFARSVGHSPSVEIRKARLEHARRMLAETDLSLTDIALACGYSDLPHMDRDFRKAMGCAPRDLPRQGVR